MDTLSGRQLAHPRQRRAGQLAVSSAAGILRPSRAACPAQRLVKSTLLRIPPREISALP
jgi:hypothetical protein